MDNQLFKVSIKYILQGIIIAIAAYYVPIISKTSLRKPIMSEIFYISLTAAVSMFMLDYFYLNEQKNKL